MADLNPNKREINVAIGATSRAIEKLRPPMRAKSRGCAAGNRPLER